MAREIKFRGKTVPDGRWVYGYYVVMENETKTVTRHAIMDLLDKDNQYIKDGKSYHMSVSVVDAETVGQFTGLHDKNGKEIYEGDIVSDIKGKMKVDGEWVDQTEIFAVEYHGAAFNISHLSLVSNDSVEVIGNIHDNPELLKGGKQ